MKIIITANKTWNLAHFRRPIIEALVADGHEVVALAPSDDAVEDVKAMGSRHIPVQMDSKGIDPIKDLRLLRAFKRIFRAERPDIILSFTIKNNIYGALASKSLGIPYIPNVSGLGTVFLSANWLEKVAAMLYRSAFKRLRHVVFQNGDDRDLFVNRGIISRQQALLVPGSGIDLDHFSPSKEESESGKVPTFLLIARMLRDKGVIEYVEAARLIKADFPDARFQLLGACGVENRTAIGRPTVDQWVAEGTIEYLGELPDVRPAIMAVNCVVLPSYREGLPRALLEASAMGKPVIATDVAGCRDVVDQGVTGLLCEVRSVGSLENAIRSFVTMPDEERDLMGKAGRKKTESEFGQDLVVEIYRTTIKALVALDG